MRQLFLMRHAKASSDHGCLDIDRPLAPRGWQQAREAGLLLVDQGISHVLCSTSVRTRQTLEALNLPGEPTVEYMAALYLGSAETILQRISEIDDSVNALLVVGHSPGIPSLGAQLAWASQQREADQMQCWFPTSSFTQFTISGTWSDLLYGDAKAELGQTVRPKDF